MRECGGLGFEVWEVQAPRCPTFLKRRASLGFARGLEEAEDEGVAEGDIWVAQAVDDRPEG
jgi:hypothetical protein